jgi:hypothetical protein
MKRLYLLLCVASILGWAGCGSSNSSGSGFGGGGTSGNFSNSNLSGNFTYQVTGYDLTTGTPIPFYEAGAFVADGKGNITGGEDDFAEGSLVVQNGMSPGTYSISKDGTGVLTLDFANGGGLQLAIAVNSSPTIYMTVNITQPTSAVRQVTGTGVAVSQTTSAFSTAPSGPFAFRMHSVSAVSGSIGRVGMFNVAGGTVTSGNMDENQAGSLSQLTLTSGLFNTADSFGRGTGSLTDSSGTTIPFAYYVADSSHVYFFLTEGATANGLGQAEAQTGPFSANSFSGSYVFGSRGDDNFSLGGVNTVGQFNASGGAISGGQYDAVVDGVPVSPGTFASGTYTVASNGRVVLSLNSSASGTIQEICWLVSPSRTLFLTNDTTKVEDGTADLQQSATFSNSSVNGQFGFAMDGFVTNPTDFFDRVGYMHWDGAGNLGLKEFLNVSGTASQPGIINGSYSVAANGRATGSLSGLSSNLVFYLVSGSQGYMLQGDSGVEINGMMGTP